MKILTIVALIAAVFLARPALADDLSYDDPGMHYRAPDGWQRVPIGDAAGADGAPTAVFVLRASKNQPRAVTITIDDYDGTLAEYASSHERDVRQHAGDNGAVLVERNDLTKLPNGMPVVYLVWTLSTDTGAPLKNYEYLFIDGQRSVSVKYSGYASDIGDADAAATLKSLYAVAYPKKRADSR
jgi:hypothetical protein